MKRKNYDQLPPELEQYLALCKRAYDRMVEEDRWPWPGEPPKGIVVDLEDKSDDL